MNQYLVATAEALWIVGFLFALFMVYAGSWHATILGMGYIGLSLAVAMLISKRSRIKEQSTTRDKSAVNHGNDV